MHVMCVTDYKLLFGKYYVVLESVVPMVLLHTW
jgi:hypothetical protein